MSEMFLQRLLILCFFAVVDAITSNGEHVGYTELDTFNYCIKGKQRPQLSECVGRTAINFLQRVDEQDNFTLADSFIAKRDERAATRSLVNVFDIDPVDFRGILENAGAVMGQRSLEWHMDGLYPGLMLKIGPTNDANSVAEFMLDPAYGERTFQQEEPSTARTLTKLYLLPLLLSLKFNLVALVPLVFTAICLLLKKSLFLIKLILFVSGFLGVGGAGAALGSLGGLGLGGLSGLLRPTRPNIYGGLSGIIPGKTTVYNEEYDTQDWSHASSPYKRNGRKIKFDKPRDLHTTSPTTIDSSTPKDHFYDYEKILYEVQERSKSQAEEKPERSSYWQESTPNFPTTYTNDNLGWKVINLNT